MLSPKRVKHRKVHRGRAIPKGSATKGNKISFGEIGLVSTENEWITSRQIEAARIASTRFCKREGKVFIRIFPHIPYTKKPAETRQGKGKGSVEKWVAAVKNGTVMFEIGGVDLGVARRALELAAGKLPVKCKIVERRNLG
ncbi:50S ribosomal protein L16 [Thiospirochaeta perfilievii]|uniref:Large ribosomal subunit protein uL16 n=1 Tax=Thiospirochaeta perfilievii TaxID=252967 RepID=A0A5C1QAL3_9SPIO|nr:50S ribosomal protein L16 [Thiospirochaeta perfilievii]QEN05163.1 50S ribosomal protein L16 [Thiospirochaeta perfilievii]